MWYNRPTVKRLLVLFFLLVIISLSGFVWWNRGHMAPDSKNKENKIFVIQKGAPVREIGNTLKAQGLIRDPVVFFLTLKMQGKDRNIQAGSYRLSPSMNVSEIIENLEHGTLDIWITIPEGLRAEEIAAILKEKLSEYDDSWVAELKKNEGYLFPDTYLIPQTASLEDVLAILDRTFNQKITEAGLSLDDPALNKILTIASLIEREALFDDDQHLISSVIHNRLEIDMPLQIDATVQYALGFSKSEGKWWRKNLTREDLQVQSLYNTYEKTGLPPGPIASPGIQSIEAAKNPEQSDYLFYIHDAKGRAHFAEDLDGHNENINKYLN